MPRYRNNSSKRSCLPNSFSTNSFIYIRDHQSLLTHNPLSTTIANTLYVTPKALPTIMNDYVYIFILNGWPLILDLLPIIFCILHRWMSLKMITRASLATSRQWIIRFYPLSIWFAIFNSTLLVAAGVGLILLSRKLSQTCTERYPPEDCANASKSWHTFCIWLIMPGIVAVMVIVICVARFHQLITRARNNDTLFHLVLYHPQFLVYGHALLIICRVCSNLPQVSGLLSKETNFRTWHRVTIGLAVAAIITYIVASGLTIYGWARLSMEHRVERALTRSGAIQLAPLQHNRGQRRRAQREWLLIVNQS